MQVLRGTWPFGEFINYERLTGFRRWKGRGRSVGNACGQLALITCVLNAVGNMKEICTREFQVMLDVSC